MNELPVNTGAAAGSLPHQCDVPRACPASTASPSITPCPTLSTYTTAVPTHQTFARHRHRPAALLSGPHGNHCRVVGLAGAGCRRPSGAEVVATRQPPIFFPIVLIMRVRSQCRWHRRCLHDRVARVGGGQTTQAKRLARAGPSDEYARMSLRSSAAHRGFQPSSLLSQGLHGRHHLKVEAHQHGDRDPKLIQTSMTETMGAACWQQTQHLRGRLACGWIHEKDLHKANADVERKHCERS